jgi:thiol-disulfide isomerase/thioredoxin
VPVGARGLAGVHQRSEELASQRQSFGLRRFTTEFRWDGGKPPAENALSLRLLGDEIIITTQMHRFIPLPDNKFFVGVCRKAFPIGADFCHACDVLAPAFDGDNKLKKRNGLVPVDVAVALAVEMDAVMNGRVFAGWTPKMVEFEIPQVTDAEKSGEATVEVKEYRALLNRLGEPGSKVKVPNIGLMIGTLSGQQALFDYATRRKTISDRVFEIARHGKGLETKWDWNHEGPDQESPDPSVLLASYKDKYPFELPEEWVIRNGSEDKYNHFFKLNGAGESEESAAAASDKDEGVDPVSDSRTALMERLKGK